MAAQLDGSEVDALLREIDEANMADSRSQRRPSEGGNNTPPPQSAVASAVSFSTYTLLPTPALEGSPATKAPPPVAMPVGRRLAPLDPMAAASPSPVSRSAAFDKPIIEGLEVKLPVAPELPSPARSLDQQQPPAAPIEGHAVNFLPILHGRHIQDTHGIAPRGRWGHTLTALNESLYSFGGVTVEGSVTNDLFDFQTARKSWEPVHTSGRMGSESEVPVPRAQHSAVGFQGRYLVVFGGTPDQGSSCLGDVRWYDTLLGSWTNIGAESYRHEPTGRFGHTAVVVDNKMYIFGGKCARKVDGGDESKGLLLANDVLVFCLGSRAWKKRVHVAKDDTTPVPCKRYNHAACVLGGIMYIHGGEGLGGKVLSDTWAFSFATKQWSLVHDEPDSIPRCRHFLVGCGEALLVVGGAGSRESRPVPVAIMPVLETTEDGLRAEPIALGFTRWIPVPLGNMDSIQATKKSFGGAVHSGFVYLFGGVTATEQANNVMTRCLAMDGIPTAASPNLLLHEQFMRFLDDKALWDVQMSVGGEVFGATKVVLQQRVPKFYEELIQCRNDAESHGGGMRIADFEHLNVEATVQRVPIYDVHGTNRAKGMSVSFSPKTLRQFLEYVYGAVPPPIEDADETHITNLMDIAVAYEAVGLMNYLNAKNDTALAGTPKRSPTKLKAVQGGRASVAKAMLDELGADMCKLLDSGSHATATIVFQDPHTSHQSTHPVHPAVLAVSSKLFRQLIVPLIVDGKTSTTVGGISAKRSAGSASSRRGIIVGPVPVPTPSVKYVLRYLYRGALDVPAEVALPTMIAASALDLAPLQAHCESIVAREEVNFETSCSYLSLATSHKAMLLEELALLTAAIGYEDVKGSVPFNGLPPTTQKIIQNAALELQGKWSAPLPKAQTEQQDPEVYQQRFAKSGSM